MGTFYEGHDKVYQIKRRNREYGWSTAVEAEENFARIQTVLPHDLPAAEPRVLDLGCGSGELTWHYAKLWGAVTGVDISATAIRWARERLPEARFVEGSVLDGAVLPLESFDLVLDSNCLHCVIGTDRRRLLVNAGTWLKRGGYLVLHTMCNEPVGDLLDGYDPRDRCIYRGDIAIRYLGQAESILQEVAGAGFELVRHQVFHQDQGPDMLVSLHRNAGGKN